MNVVECIKLTKNFQDFWGRDKVRAVDNLDLVIRPGEIFGLLGPNGSGKSTTIKLLLGLLYPSSGAARVFGKPPTDTAMKSQIGFMPEESYLYRYLNAYETLDYYARLFKLDHYERRRRTDQLIEMVGLKRAGKRPVGTYSKGMARRIGLAQALINDPDLLILDEPTTGLDPVGTRQIKDVIKTLGQRGKTVILCSHLLADVEDVCDRVAIMYGGRRLALGAVNEILERRDATQMTTRQLDEKTIQKIRDVVAKAGLGDLTVQHPSDRLEDLFLRIVGKAQRENLETSGAESTSGVSEFLSAHAESGASLVGSLVDAGKTEPLPAAAEQDHVEPSEMTTESKTEVLDRLIAEEPKEAAAETPVNSPVAMPKPDEEVLQKLLQPERLGEPDPQSGDDTEVDSTNETKR
ncbi:MAG: ABC transporter ATP-binding protein [Phycisphaerales bacterium]|nr:ABC transporter ATP-binding protein [Phycisphaerales bacterium]